MNRDPEVLALVARTQRLVTQTASLHGDLLDHQSHLADFLKRADEFASHVGMERRERA